MNNIIIEDNMKKESKICIILSVIFFVCAIVTIVLINNNFYEERLNLAPTYFFILGGISLFVFLDRMIYKFIVTNEKIIIRILFRNIELNIPDLINYTCKRYKKSVFFQFRLFTKEKRISIYTRYKDEFIKILEENNISSTENPSSNELTPKKIHQIKWINQICFSIIIVSLISIPITLILCFIFGETEIYGIAEIIKNTWIILLFIPFSVTSIILGIKFMENEKIKSNCIAGIIVTILLIIFGTFRFSAGKNIKYDDYKALLEVGDKLDFDFPNNIKVVTYDYDEYVVSYTKVDDKEKNLFEKDIENSDIWTKTLSSIIKNALPLTVQVEVEENSSFLFYNLTTEEYNMFPSNFGEYDCIIIFYNSSNGKLTITSYKLIYSK